MLAFPFPFMYSIIYVIAAQTTWLTFSATTVLETHNWATYMAIPQTLNVTQSTRQNTCNRHKQQQPFQIVSTTIIIIQTSYWITKLTIGRCNGIPHWWCGSILVSTLDYSHELMTLITELLYYELQYHDHWPMRWMLVWQLYPLAHPKCNQQDTV